MREESENLGTNQQAIGIKHVFRFILIKAWKGIDFSGNKHTTYNRIVNQYCMDYY